MTNRVAIFSQVGFIFEILLTTVQEKGWKVVVVVTSHGPPSRKDRCYLDVVSKVPRGVDVIVSDHPNSYATLISPYNVDILLCGTYSWRLRPNLLAIPKKGCINIHNSTLPSYRGPDPLAAAILDNANCGFTAHYMSKEFDTGNILVTTELQMNINDFAEDLFPKFRGAITKLVHEALDKVDNGEEGIKQPEKGSEAPLLPITFQIINFYESTSMQVHNQVRSWWGCRGPVVYKGAVGTIKNFECKTQDKDIRIYRTFYMTERELHDNFEDWNPEIECGTYFKLDRKSGESSVHQMIEERFQNYFFVMCKDLPLLVLNFETDPAKVNIHLKNK